VASPRVTRLPLILAVPALVAAAIALTPLIYLAVRATENGLAEIVDVVWRERTARLIARSVLLAATVTLLCLVIGVSMAWLTTRTALRGRRWMTVVAALPLAIPTYVAAFAWISVFPGLSGFSGSVLVLTMCSYPYVFLPVAAALSRLDPALEEVSRSLGQGPWRTFSGITLRQLRPAAAAGALLVALYVLSDFGAVSILRYDTFTRVIYTSYRSSFDRTPAAILGCLLVLLTIAIVHAEGRSRGRASYARLGAGAARVQPRIPLGRWSAAAYALLFGIAALALGVPFATLTYWLTSGASRGIDVVELGSAVWSTLWISALGAAVTTVLAIPVGIVAARYRGRLPRLLEQATYVGHALPGIVVALALVFLSVRYAYPIYQRAPVLVFAYAVLFLPAAVGAVRASVAQSPRSLEEVGRSLGHGQLSVLRTVTLPLAAPGVAAGAALVLLTCMKELPATVLLRPTEFDTLATELWTRTDVGQYAAAAPYAALLVILAALPTFLLVRRPEGETLAAGGEQ
jgi:iron(III) transport system permease protein